MFFSLRISTACLILSSIISRPMVALSFYPKRAVAKIRECEHPQMANLRPQTAWRHFKSYATFMERKIVMSVFKTW
jgi:hypothetical protein